MLSAVSLAYAVSMAGDFGGRPSSVLSKGYVVDEASGKGKVERDRRNGPKAALYTLSVE